MVPSCGTTVPTAQGIARVLCGDLDGGDAFRIELIRVHLALSDLAGARTLMREVDELLKRRPSMGILVDQAGAPRARLSRKRGSGAPEDPP